MAPLDTIHVNYGLDAPGICRNMVMAGAAGLALAILALFLSERGWIAAVAAIVGLLLAAYGFFMAGYMLWSSRVGKVRTRERLLDRLQSIRRWTGAETVLDVGCGRGLMAIGAAKRLLTGRVIGIDIWNAADQLGSTPEAVGANAAREGVAYRIDIRTADARQLPLADASIDVVLSHWVVHNLPSEADRATALAEMWRVLKPGGTIVLADISFVQDYAEQFRRKGASRIIHDSGGWQAALLGILSGGSFRPQAVFVSRD